jgi:hypothetical protein
MAASKPVSSDWLPVVTLKNRTTGSAFEAQNA